METKHIRIFPCNREEFETVEELRIWLEKTLPLEREGRYRLRTLQNIKSVPQGSIVLFRFDQEIIGEAIVRQDIQEINEEINGVNYVGAIYFEPSSIRIYKRPLPVSFIEQLSNKNLAVPRSYYKIYDFNIHKAILEKEKEDEKL